MKEFWKWIVKNFSYVFTIIGILLTLYFSIVYVPDYIKENENEKTRNINLDLIETIQEIVYNKHELNEKKINALIKGKEIKHRLEYPHTVEELLIQTEEAFMYNKFIPLEQRITIVNRLDSIRVNIKSTTQIETTKKPDKSTSKISNYLGVLISIFSGIIVTILGIWSFFIKLRKEKKQTINNEIEKEKEGIQEQISNSINFENIISGILEKINVKFDRITGKSFGCNFIVFLYKKSFFISTKYMSNARSLNLDGINIIIDPYKRFKENGVIILNTIDNRSRNYFNQFLRKLDSNVKLIISSDVEKIETELKKYINSLRKQISQSH